MRKTGLEPTIAGGYTSTNRYAATLNASCEMAEAERMAVQWRILSERSLTIKQLKQNADKLNLTNQDGTI